MKKTYNQPSVNVLEISSGELMQSLLHVSTGESGGGHGEVHMPRRGDIIP